MIEEDGLTRGLYFNRRMSLLFVLESDEIPKNPFSSDIPISKECFVLLGSPTGPPSFYASTVLQIKNKENTKILSILPDQKD